MQKYLEGKVAVVTGSGQGIGRAVALALAEQGAKVVTNNRKPGQNIDSQLDDVKHRGAAHMGTRGVCPIWR